MSIHICLILFPVQDYAQLCIEEMFWFCFCFCGFFFFWKEGCWGEKLAVGVHRKREILLVTTFLCRDSVLTAFCVVSLPISKLWDIVYIDDIFILLVLVLVWGYSVCNQKVLKLMEQRIYFYELIQFFPNNWKQDVLY